MRWTTAVALLVLVLVAGCGGDPPAADADPTDERTGALASGADASCAEEYSPSTLVTRAFAFDGVVVAIGDSVSDRDDEVDLDLPGVTFDVRAWFAGGADERVTVDLQAAEGSYDIGSRLLVSGESRWDGPPLDAPIAWTCGFTRYHDAETARLWEESFGTR